MDFKLKETTLTDGSKVFDVDLFTNGQEKLTLRPMCIFSCTSESAAEKFLAGLNQLVDNFTVESLDEV